MDERWFLPFPIESFDLRSPRVGVTTSLDASEVERRARLGASVLVLEKVRGTFVASSVSAGWQNPVVCLSIWLSGAAVAPIDLDDGKARVEAMLQSLKARVLVVVGERREVSRLATFAAKVLTTEDLFSHQPQRDISTKGVIAKSRNESSHCFFTSGTTGSPKGCVSSFAALAAYAEARNRVDGVDSTSRIACCSAHTFDPSLGDLAQASLSGATLCVSASRVRDTSLRDFVKAARGTHVTSTPALWATVDENLSLDSLSLGGERMPDSMVAKCVYGVTECCVYQTSCGEPLAGTKIKVVDGQILIGGDCLIGARYLDADLPCCIVDGERFYRSGDSGALVDGKLVIYGRLDDQVKIDGVRVELGDVEATLLAECRGLVLECRAAQLPDHGKIVCVVKTASSRDCDDDDNLARRAIHAKLSLFSDVPRRLKPARIEFLKQQGWPTTANGKTDRRALLSLFDDREECRRPQNRFEPLRTPTEVAVSRCWRELLVEDDQRPASAFDDFVTMGGDSLAALRAARRLEAWASGQSCPSRGEGGKFGDELVLRFPPEKMFELRTVRRYAAFVADSAAFDEGFAVEQIRAEYEETIEDVAGDAAEACRPDVVSCLLDCLGNNNNRRRRTMSPLARAALAGSVECLVLLLTKYATTVTDVQRRTPLAIAAAGGFSECCALLLEAGAPLAARDSKRQSPLHHCARTGNAATMRILLEKREGRHPEKLVNARDRWGRPPLAWVALRSDYDDDESLEVAKILCDAGADPRLRVLKDSAQHRHTSLVGETPLDICLRRGSEARTAGRLAELFEQY